MENEELMKEFIGGGITVNAVASRFIDTDIVRSVPDEAMKSILSKIPLGRLGKASEVAGAVAYLASEDGDYITGQIIDINGGLYI
jgi:NAD(P)-dependent dehydrogenase (short-subunit alcohol dehydrogenase family)